MVLRKRRCIFKSFNTFEIVILEMVFILFINVMILLLFIVRPQVSETSVCINLPTGKLGMQECVISIDTQHNLYFNSFPVNKNHLVLEVLKSVGRGINIVYIRADKTVWYGDVVSLVLQLKALGITQFVLSTRSA